MIINTSTINLGSWKTTVSGFITGALTFLASYLNNGHTLNFKDPVLWMGICMAGWGIVQKDSNKTGGTSLVPNAVPDAALHQEANNETVDSKITVVKGHKKEQVVMGTVAGLTPPTQQAQVAQPVSTLSPGVAKILGLFTTYGAIAAATVQQVQSDISQSNHLGAVQDSVTGVAAGLAQAQPAWTADIQASLSLFNAFLPLVVGLFHKK